MASWKEIVRNIAPTIGVALGGPMAGAASKFIADKLLGKQDATTEEISEVILNASPEQLVKLKELDQQFKLEMKKLEIDVYEIEFKDRDSARKLFEVNIWPQIILSGIFVIGYFVVLIIVIWYGDRLALGNSNLFSVFTAILGVLTAAIPQILSFWFGSSLGSKEKTKGMNVTTHKAVTNQSINP